MQGNKDQKRKRKRLLIKTTWKHVRIIMMSENRQDNNKVHTENCICIISGKCKIQIQKVDWWLPRALGGTEGGRQGSQRHRGNCREGRGNTLSWLWWWFHGYLPVQTYQILYLPFFKALFLYLSSGKGEGTRNWTSKLGSMEQHQTHWATLVRVRFILYICAAEYR